MQHSRARIIVDGVVAGLIGGAVIALWFFIFDLAHGRPFETPRLLAATVLHGARAEALTQNVWLFLIVPYVIQYSIVHFAAFAIIGAVAALLIEAAQHEPALFGSLLLIFVIAFQIFFIGVIMLLGPGAAAAMPWWKIIIGNLMATAAMLVYFFARNPLAAHNLLGPWINVRQASSRGWSAR
jgi:hypothetical protein